MLEKLRGKVHTILHEKYIYILYLYCIRVIKELYKK